MYFAEYINLLIKTTFNLPWIVGLFLYVLFDPVVFTNEQKRSRVFSVSVIDLFLSLIITLTGLQVNWATQITWCTTELFLPWLLENLCPRLWPPSCKLLTVWVWCKCSAATRKIMYCLRDAMLPLLGRSRHSTVTISTPPYSSPSPGPPYSSPPLWKRTIFFSFFLEPSYYKPPWLFATQWESNLSLIRPNHPWKVTVLKI